MIFLQFCLIFLSSPSSLFHTVHFLERLTCAKAGWTGKQAAAHRGLLLAVVHGDSCCGTDVGATSLYFCFLSYCPSILLCSFLQNQNKTYFIEEQQSIQRLTTCTGNPLWCAPVLIRATLATFILRLWPSLLKMRPHQQQLVPLRLLLRLR